MTQTPLSDHALRVSKLSQSAPTPFQITPSAKQLEVLKAAFGLSGLRKMTFVGEVAPDGRSDWVLTGHLGATVVQPCVATLEPVTTRIETDVIRRYLVDFTMSQDAETEMPEDDSVEALGSHIDPGFAMEEALSLALPVYPRADATEPVSVQTTEPGLTAMTDEDTKPFAGLAELRRKMDDSGET